LFRIKKYSTNFQAYTFEKKIKADNNFSYVKYINIQHSKPYSFEQHYFNERISDALNPDREIPDTRNNLCKKKSYNIKDLPATTVIITFHNEARSTLYRTVKSVLNKTPAELLKEILLIDDHSDSSEDCKLLENLPKVKCYRNKRREGLIRSRVIGVTKSNSDVLTFLDSHIECNTEWLQPMLQQIKVDNKTIVSPVIDVIKPESFKYMKTSSSWYGGFDWSLHFKWVKRPPEELKSPSYDFKPFKTPMIAGGLFSISKYWFLDTGIYDTSMDVWGGENFELSFKNWMCGGTVLIVPCSRVGHVFRKKHPYKFPRGGNSATFSRNTRRVAEVWMDKYKEEFLKARPIARKCSFTKPEIESLNERKKLRRNLNCNSFQWYLDHIYPSLLVPEIYESQSFKLIVSSSLQCVDVKVLDDKKYLFLRNTPSDRSFRDAKVGFVWTLNKNGQLCSRLFKRKKCAMPLSNGKRPKVVLQESSPLNSTQRWMLKDGYLVHRLTNLCITCGILPNKNFLVLDSIVNGHCLRLEVLNIKLSRKPKNKLLNFLFNAF